MSAEPIEQPSHGLGCARHSWCVRETHASVADGSVATFHHSAPGTIRAGDDSVMVALIATEDDTAVYVEVEVTTTDRGPTSVWLTEPEASHLAATLTTTRVG